MKHRTAIAIAVVLCIVVAGPGASAAPAERGRPVTVMTRNLYLGADLLPVVASTGFPGLLAATASVFATAQTNDFGVRAAALAREIDEAEPALIGLQEVSLWRRGPVGVLDGPATPSTIVAVDFLTVLIDRLAEHGLEYAVAVEQSTFDAEVPSALGYDVRLTQRNVILVRRGLPPDELSISNPSEGLFANNTVIPTLVGPLVDVRGWTSIDARVERRPFRFINAHLDSYNPVTRLLQAQELLDGPAANAGAVVIVGDLNAIPGSPPVETLTAGGFRDVWAEIGSGAGLTCCFSEDLRILDTALTQRIDYVLVSAGVGLRRARLVGTDRDDRPASMWPSDHAGIVAMLTP